MHNKLAPKVGVVRVTWPNGLWGPVDSDEIMKWNYPFPREYYRAKILALRQTVWAYSQLVPFFGHWVSIQICPRSVDRGHAIKICT